MENRMRRLNGCAFHTLTTCLKRFLPCLTILFLLLGSAAHGQTAAPAKGTIAVDAYNHIAVTSDRSGSVTVFDTTSASAPRLLSTYTAPSELTGVALAGESLLVSGQRGVEVLDISNSKSPVFERLVQLDSEAVAVKAAGNLGYTAFGSTVVLFDISTGTILDRHDYSSLAVNDLALSGDYLYVLSSDADAETGFQIAKVQLQGSLGQPVASWTSSSGQFGRGRMSLFAGDSFIYVGSVLTQGAGQVPGLQVLEDEGTSFKLKSVPQSLDARMVRPSGVGLLAFTGAADGAEGTSRLGVLETAGSPDLAKALDPSQVLHVLNTSGPARAITLYQGYVYVAAGSAGLQVIPYASPNGSKAPSSLSLSTSTVGEAPEAGSLARLTAKVVAADQVRKVDFYLNGEQVASTGGYPFEYRFLEADPDPATAQMVSACVEDIDGNSACSEPEDLNAKSKNALTVTSVTPLSSSHTPRSSKLAISAQFSLPLDVSTVKLQNVSLVKTTSQSSATTPIPLAAVQYQIGSKTISIQPKSALAGGSYKVVLLKSIKSTGGTVMAADYAWTFDVTPATDTWTSTTSGDWNTSANWSLGTPPAVGDNVVINKPGVTITLSSDSYQGGTSTQINNLSVGVTSTLTIAGGNLAVAGTGTASALNLSNGTLTGPGTVTLTGTGSSWTGGIITGSVLVQTGAALAIKTPDVYPNAFGLQGGGTLVNSGTVNHNMLNGGYGMYVTGGATITNNGAWNLTSDVTVSGDATSVFNNAGTFTKASGASTSNWSLSFGGAGAVNIQAGTINFGVPATMGNLTMTGGGVTGNYAITVTNTFNWTGGEVSGTSTSSTFTIGHLAMSPSGSVTLYLASPNQYRLLNVTGSANLQGSLTVSYPPGYTFPLNAGVNAIESSSHNLTGSFANIYYAPFSNKEVLVPNYTTSIFSLIPGIQGNQPQTITFGALANKTYGVAPITLTATASSGLPVTYTVSGPATVSGSRLSITSAGTVTVTASQAGNNQYAPAPTVSQSFSVAKATLTATAANLSRAYGAANPMLTYTLTGFVNGDSSSVVDGTATLTTTATSTSPVGTYPITFATENLTAANYTFTYVAGTLTVLGGASQTITFGPLANQTYGVSPVTLAATASSGLPVTYTVKGPATLSGSTLSITGAGFVTVTASQAGNSSYAPAPNVSQSFSVAKAVLTATAANLSREYGAANPPLTYIFTGFVNGDTIAVVSGSATLSTTATSTSPVGTYPITFSSENLAANNYAFTYVAGTLTVLGGVSQTITFGPLANQTYGVLPITLTATASSGLPVSYTVKGPAAVSASTLTITGAGSVTVTASQPGNSTYAAAPFVSQTFTVSKALLIVTAANQSRQYGAANPTLIYGTTGFVNGDTPAVMSGSATLSTTATSTSSTGTYPISFSTEGLTASNYTFNYVAGTLTIRGGVAQTITFGPLANQTYGNSPITLTATASSGLAVSYLVTGPANISGSTLTIIGAGTVTVTATQPGNSNYGAAPSVSRSFTVAKAVLTATAANLGRQYGAVNPTLNYALTGFVDGDTLSVVSGSATLTTTATSTSPVGTYPITFATENLAAVNYTFTYVAGMLTVSSGASQTITFGPLSNQTYGASPIMLTATASSGLPVTYTVSGPATVSGSTLTITGTGSATVTASQPGNNNYAAAPNVSRSFSVAKAVLTATAANLSRQYGVANPTLTYAVTGFVNGDTSAVVSGSATLTTTATSTSPAGTYPITFATEDLAAPNYTITYVAGTLTVTAATSVATPSFNPPGGTFTVEQTVALSSASTGASIYYTIDGTTPGAGSTLYTAPIQVRTNETINAIAILNGVSSTISTATYTINAGQCTTINYANGFTSRGLSLNGGATVKNNLLQLTDGGFFEARSAFYSEAVPVTNFTTDFTFQLLYPLGDGITFTIQSNNAQEVGQAGGGLGYAGIPNSVAVKADLFDNNGEGFDSTGLYLNGAYPSTPAVSLEPFGINLHSGHIFAVHIVYANDMATGTITDTVTSQSAKMTVHGDLSKVVGDTAYVGFTGGTGALTATQDILSWSYRGGAGCAAQ